MRRSTAFPFMILFWTLFIVHPGCGTDVGNSGKPITSEPGELAAVAGMQHDEVISSVNDGSDREDALALSWMRGGAEQGRADVDPVCTPLADGSVDVHTELNTALEREYGRPAKRKVQKDDFKIVLDMNYSVDASLGTLICSNNQPVLSLAQLAELKTVSKLEKNRKRSVILQADGSTVSESELTVSSQRTVQFKKISGSFPIEPLVMQRESSLNSTVSLLRKNADAPITRSVKTLADEPMVLQKTRTRGAGVTRVEIVSGAVVSTHQDAKSVVLRYKNLVLNTGSSCHPSSGSIEGQIFARSDETVAESTFSIVFDSDGATLRYEDGSEEEIELESCQL